MLRHFAIFCLILNCFLGALAALAAPPTDLERAEQLYQKTEYQQALQLLESNQDKGPAAYELIGKAYYMLADYKKAGRALEKAIEADPNNSDYFDWLGKVYGKRAETSRFFTAWSYAGKCRSNFERAVELDSRNMEAIDDLFEFYLGAPGLLGGGVEKADAVSELARERDPGKYHYLQARLAEKQKDFSGQEKHLRLALESAPSGVGRILDLAQFLSRLGKYEESEALFERAKKIAPGSAELKFKRAKTYLQTGRNREQARRLLQQYLESSLTPDDPPRSEAERLLKEATRG